MREKIELSEKDKVLVIIGVDGIHSQLGRFSSDWHMQNNSLLVKWDACRWIRETIWWLLLFFFHRAQDKAQGRCIDSFKVGLKIKK